MRRLIFAFGLVSLLVLASPVLAQQAITLDSVQVQFWPEYDAPEMLVIYTIELPAEVELPLQVSLRIPAAAGEPNAVAVAVDDNLLTAEYTREVIGDWAEILVTADSPVVHVEYYDPGLAIDGKVRSFDYSWPGDYAVGQFSVRVQTPAGASNMAFSQEMGNPQTGADGLGYYSRDFGVLAAGEMFDFSISYSKSSDALTVDAPVDGSAADSSAANFVSEIPWWVWLLVGLGVVLIGFGAWSFFNDPSKNEKGGKSKYARKRGSASRGSRGGGGKAKFCHKCGAKAQSGDKFCRECGQKLRV
jgi:hypothetical protein